MLYYTLFFCWLAYTFEFILKECKNNFTEQSIEHNEITLSKYNQIINGVFEQEIIDEDVNTNDESTEENI